MIQRICLLYLILIVTYCEDGETKLEKQNKFQTEFLITLTRYREEGNCRKSILAENLVDKTLTCSRKPRGYCSINQSLITQGEINFLITEGKKVKDRNSNCETSFLQSGILLLTATTAKDEESIRSKHEYVTVSNCEDDGFILNENVRLATFSEIQLIESARGRIGRSAKLLSLSLLTTASIREKAKLCLEQEYSENEIDFFSNLVAGKVLLEVSK
ncbi:hypothetical protein EHQ58_04400 [Leptospira ognonensis]|uniref:Uncharacterized protein n=1 Tax=Leptospira ognonensis TaxID=2484945 RepID=A0A4R9K8X3_9LEPT|nr:hypothetical protein [Leptospira ognonensis]TGL61860.1 hypothetical protein EHQ58_04400 [Leptospira ognonensis]